MTSLSPASTPPCPTDELRLRPEWERRPAATGPSRGPSRTGYLVCRPTTRPVIVSLDLTPTTDPDDKDALERAQDNSTGVLRSIPARTLADIEEALVKDPLNALPWLVAAGLLHIRLALRVNARGGYSRSLFYAKTGVFSDDSGHHVSFPGSANETAGGLVENFEHLDCFRSWRDQEGWVQAAIEDFEALWTGTAPGVRVIAFTQAERDLLERFRNPHNPAES